MVHAARMSGSGLYSFEDEIFQDLIDASFLAIPENDHHSIAWIIWHLGRIEDVTMNILVADKPQLFYKDDWAKKLKMPLRHTGNGMTDKEIIDFSKKIDIKALKRYRIAVGKNTRKIVAGLKPDDLKQNVDPERIKRIWKEKAMLSNARGIVNYWGRRTIAGLLLMPPTRHCFLHLNEARRIKEKLLKAC
jgi:hypothetical protein